MVCRGLDVGDGSPFLLVHPHRVIDGILGSLSRRDSSGVGAADSRPSPDRPPGLTRSGARHLVAPPLAPVAGSRVQSRPVINSRAVGKASIPCDALQTDSAIF